MDIKKILFKTNEIDVEKALPDAIIYCNKEGKIQWVNDKASALFETSKMHLLTSNIADFIENTHNLINNAKITSKPVIAKLHLKEVYFSMALNEIDEGFVLSFRDLDAISTSKSNISCLNNELNNIDKNQFLLKIANDFKSPLQSIVGFSQAMADGLGGEMSEQQDKYIRIIRKNSSDLMYFITKLLDLTQTEVEIKAPEMKLFDITNTISSIVRFNEQLYKGKDLRWNINIEENFKNTLLSDENYIKIVLQNILEIILKSVDMGEINIDLLIPDVEQIKSKNLFGNNYIMISISSNSLLLSENDLEHMFDPYVIVDSANRKNLLRAIILASVQNYIKILNGVFWLESKILKNTTFNIIIPQNKIEE